MKPHFPIPSANLTIGGRTCAGRAGSIESSALAVTGRPSATHPPFCTTLDSTLRTQPTTAAGIDYKPFSAATDTVLLANLAFKPVGKPRQCCGFLRRALRHVAIHQDQRMVGLRTFKILRSSYYDSFLPWPRPTSLLFLCSVSCLRRFSRSFCLH